jgi:hypothetical protein
LRLNPTEHREASQDISQTASLEDGVERAPANIAGALARGVIVATAVVALLGVLIPIWMESPPTGTTYRNLPWLCTVAGLAGAAAFAMEIARPYLRQSWRARNAERPVLRRYSFWPAHYEAKGKPWVLLGITLSAAWLVLMMVGLS